jgi:hypothetical protein
MATFGGAMIAVSAVVALGAAVIPAGADLDANSSASALAGKLVTVSEMPSGWVTEPHVTKGSAPCANSLDIGVLHVPSAHVAYEENGGGEVFGESLNEAPTAAIARADLAKLASGWAHCNNTTFPATNGSAHVRISSVNVPAVGARSSARALTATFGSNVAYVNIVTFEQGRYVGVLAESDSTGAPPDVTTEAQLDQQAFERLQEL